MGGKTAMSSQQRSLADPRQDEYRILHEADLRDYLAGVPAVAIRLGGAPASWSISEVGDGNLNLVFIVKGAAGGIAVKQALPYVRLVGESWPLPLSRSHYEYLALTHQARLAPGLVPDVLHHNEGLALVVIFMFAAYSLFGLFANLALLINIALIFGVLSLSLVVVTTPNFADYSLRARSGYLARRTAQGLRDVASSGSPLDQFRRSHPNNLAVTLDSDELSALRMALQRFTDALTQGFADRRSVLAQDGARMFGLKAIHGWRRWLIRCHVFLS
jgi:hypothetical protein